MTVCCIRRGVLGAGAGRRGSDSSPDGLLRVAGARLASADDGYRRRGLWAFDSLNGNFASMALGYLDRSAAVVCFLQEPPLANAPILAGRAHACVGPAVAARWPCRGHAQWQPQCRCCGRRARALGASSPWPPARGRESGGLRWLPPVEGLVPQRHFGPRRQESREPSQLAGDSGLATMVAMEVLVPKGHY